MEENTVNCLFCASPCSPDFVINPCGQVKSEEESNNLEQNVSYNFHDFHEHVSSSPNSLSFRGDDEVIEEHLRAVFILRKLLKIPQETLCQFLGKGNGQFSPELWLNVCESCGDSVTQFYVTLKHLSKLERRLASIKIGLIDKMRASQDVGNHDIVWGQIREEALKQCSPPTSDERLLLEPEIQLEITDENWNVGNNHDELNQEERSNCSYKHFNENESFEHETYSHFHFDNHDDKEEDEIHFVTDFIPPPPQTKQYFYSCQLCSFQSNTKADFEAHMKLHEEGSGAIPCDNCGRPVLPSKMKWHTHPCRSGLLGNYRKRVTETRIGSNSTTHQPLGTGRFYYQCDQCPFESNSSKRYASHLKLHEEGANAIACSECGFFIEPNRIAQHQALRHPDSRGVRGSPEKCKRKSRKVHNDEDEEWTN